MKGAKHIILSVVMHGNGKGTCARAHTHTPAFLPESDPAPVVEFFTRTGFAAAGGQFDFERGVGFIQTGVFKTVVRH